MKKSISSDIHWFTSCILVCLIVICVSVAIGTVGILSVVVLLCFAAFVSHRLTASLLTKKQLVNSIELWDGFCAIRDRVIDALLGIGLQSCEDNERTRNLYQNNRSLDRRNQAGNGGGSPSNPMTELDLYAKYVIRDFVLSWYQVFSTNEQFLREIQYAFEDLTVAFVSRSRKFAIHSLVRRLIRTYHRYFINYLKSVRKQGPEGTIDVQECFEGFHFALSSYEKELRHLRNVVDLTLEVLVPADVLCCFTARKLVVTLLGDSVLFPIVNLVSDPNWINANITLLLVDLGKAETIENGHPYRYGTKFKDDLEREEPVSTPEMKDSSFSVGVSKSSDCNGESNVVKGSSLDETERFEASRSSSVSMRGSVSSGNVCSKGDSTDSEVDGIWKRMADEMPADFRNERRQEVCDIVTEKKKKALKIPLSGSLEKISDILTCTIGELERPLEFITGNLAHYFKLNVDDERTDDVGVAVASSARQSRRNSSSEEASPPSDRNVSSVLERLFPMAAGPVLSDLHWGFGQKNATLAPVDQISCQRSSSSDDESRETSISPVVNNEDDDTSPSCDVTATSEPQTKSTVPKEMTDRGGPVQEESLSYGAPFTNLSIRSSDIVEEGSNGSPYVVYCIQYDAWYRDPDLDKRTESTDGYVDVAEPRIFLQTSLVRRRFREFQTLQNCLENDPKLRPLLRGVKSPNKWTVLPFTRLDGDAVAERRLDLEKYLQALISKEGIANSHHMREFLAYGSDASIAYVRKVSDMSLPVPRIDKFIMKTMTGMFDKIKTALPSLPHDPSPVEPCGGPASQQPKASDRLLGFLNFNLPLGDDASQLRLSFDYVSDAFDSSRNVEDLMANFLVNHDVNYDRVDTALDAADAETWHKEFWNSNGLPTCPIDPLSSKVVTPPSPTIKKPMIDDGSVGDDWIDDEIPLASSLLNFSVETIADGDVMIDREPFVLLVKILFGQLLERCLIHLVDDLTTEAMFVKYLRVVRDSVWPGGVFATQPAEEPTDAEKERIYQLTLKTLRDYFPSVIVALFGRPQYDRGMKLFLDSLQHPKLLRHLVYQLLDILVDALLVRSRSQSIMEKLSSSHCSS